MYVLYDSRRGVLYSLLGLVFVLCGVCGVRGCSPLDINVGLSLAHSLTLQWAYFRLSHVQDATPRVFKNPIFASVFIGCNSEVSGTQ